MKFPAFCMFAFLAGSFVSCEKLRGPEPDPTSFLTVTLTERFMENATDKWVFATNENGELLDLVQLKPTSKSMDMQTTRSFSRVDVTILSFYDQATDDLKLETFKDFPVSELRLQFGLTPDKIINQSG